MNYKHYHIFQWIPLLTLATLDYKFDSLSLAVQATTRFVSLQEATIVDVTIDWRPQKVETVEAHKDELFKWSLADCKAYVDILENKEWP